MNYVEFQENFEVWQLPGEQKHPCVLEVLLVLEFEAAVAVAEVWVLQKDSQTLAVGQKNSWKACCCFQTNLQKMAEQIRKAAEWVHQRSY
jgi:hypothetical protein